MRGPKPTPTTTGSLPEAPGWLSERQRELWDSLIPELACNVALAPCDAFGLADAVLCLDRLREAEKDIDERGVLVTGHRGVMTKNPSIMVARCYRESLQAWSKVFGLDLKSRLRLPKSAGAESPLEAARRTLQQKASQTVQ
jgi:P27 family predicted phage terminase small subunit